MLGRRGVLVGGGALAAAGGGLLAFNAAAGRAYEAEVTAVWADAGMPSGYGAAEVYRRLVHFATLAANAHNTQAWYFDLFPDRIAIRPDFSRRTPVVDPDDHHLYASLGCAAENLRIAAEASGFVASVTGNDQGVIVRLDPAAPRPSELFAALPRRQSVRFDFAGMPLDAATISALAEAAAIPGVEIRLLTDRQALVRIAELVVAGNTLQLGDPAFREELRRWIRFNGFTAAETGDGLFSATTGAPSMPTWLGRRLFDLLLNADAENRKYERQVASSSGVAVFIADRAEPEGWIAAGRAAQRFALAATSRDIRCSFLNQPIEAVPVRAELQSYLQTDRRPDLLMRFGPGPAAPRALRRPVAAVLA
ncbi:Acg family FMN-binding oxidoreductase [Amaricoccus sp. B4]|uniref:Acg family FMN-binding oxidoreductase n=1 Tax=Amaricoccus sp. B4 TaxID=3368557 RepID=UPI003714BCEB